MASPSADVVDRRLRIAIGVLCLIGIGVAGVPDLHPLRGPARPVPVERRLRDRSAARVYSKLAGVPVAILGLAGYIGILLSLAIRNDLGRVAGFGTALVGFLFSMYLTYRERSPSTPSASGA